ncbi:MAG TPA: aminotransferase class V-fold PLP-dependent enzyme [Gemmatimonadaceae bacterium]|nr:aminotransferase class V-fold PLP-dependent enzyme [Gemmatimonadaceae bacterium]
MAPRPADPRPMHHIDTLAVHAGIAPDRATGAITQPIHLSTTFARTPDAIPIGEFTYIRDDNPTRRELEECLRTLEQGAACAAFASGSAATMSVVQTLRPGDHAIAPLDAYYGTADLLRSLFVPWSLDVSFVDMTDIETVRGALRPNTRLVWIETPSNPLIRVVDIAALARVAHAAGAFVVVDNTWTTSMLQRPLDLGADFVMYSTTKYLGGHSDVMGGAIIAGAEDERFERIRKIQRTGGAIPSPFDCWLVRRGIRSLPARMRVHCANAHAVATHLSSHPRVETVHWPGLPAHPQHAIARAQMRDFGGMMSIEVAGGRAGALGVLSRVQLFTRATSLGGPESLIEHRASVEGPSTRAPEGLLRLSIGLEHPDDLISDLDQALGRA